MAPLQGPPPQNPMEMEWNGIKNDLNFQQTIMASQFESKIWAEEVVTEEFKKGLRLATYMKFVMTLQEYPNQIELANGKAREIELIFLQAGDFFEVELHLDPLRVKILEFVGFFLGNNQMASPMFIHLALQQPDPAREWGGTWILDLFPQFHNQDA